MLTVLMHMYIYAWYLDTLSLCRVASKSQHLPIHLSIPTRLQHSTARKHLLMSSALARPRLPPNKTWSSGIILLRSLLLSCEVSCSYSHDSEEDVSFFSNVY